MAITRVETVTAVSNGANPGVAAATLGTPTTSGELVLVCYSTAPNANSPASITDNLGQTYTKITPDVFDASVHYMFGWAYKEGSAAGVTTVTVTDTSGDTQGGVIVSHYTGVATSASLDAHSTIADGGTGPWSSASITTTDAVELLVGFDFAHNSGGSDVQTAASGSWNQRGSIVGGGANFDGGNGQSLAFADQITSVSGSYANTGTIAASTTDHNYCAVAAFKATPSSSGYTVINGKLSSLIDVNAGGVDVDPLSYKDGITLTSTELATLAATPGVAVTATGTTAQSRLILKRIIQNISS